MSHTVWFDAPLTCQHCGEHSDAITAQMYSGDLLLDARDQKVKPGELIIAEPADFADAYFKIGEPQSASDYSVLEQWSCPHCAAVQWAKILFEHCGDEQFRLSSVDSIALDKDTLFQFNFISRKLEYEIATDLDRSNLLYGFRHFI